MVGIRGLFGEKKTGGISVRSRTLVTALDHSMYFEEKRGGWGSPSSDGGQPFLYLAGHGPHWHSALWFH